MKIIFYLRAPGCVHICIHTYKNTEKHTCIHTYIQMHIHIHPQTHIYIYTHLHIYTYIYMHINTYTRIHFLFCLYVLASVCRCTLIMYTHMLRSACRIADAGNDRYWSPLAHICPVSCSCPATETSSADGYLEIQSMCSMIGSGFCIPMSGLCVSL